MTYEYKQYLAHYGIKGQKWGVRRYQNEDGSLTEEGTKRYRYLNEAYKEAEHQALNDTNRSKSTQNKYNNAYSNRESFFRSIDLDKYVESKYSKKTIDSLTKDISKFKKEYDKTTSIFKGVLLSNIIERKTKKKLGSDGLKDSLTEKWYYKKRAAE